MHMFTYICAFMHVCLVVFIVIQWYRWYRLANVCIPGMLLACCSNVFCVNIASTDARDAFSSSKITFFTDGFTLYTLCPSPLNISASLCWMQHKHLCTPVLNSTLEKKDSLVSIAASMMNICGKKNIFVCLFFKHQFWLFNRNMTLLQWTNTLRCVCRWEAPRCVDWKLPLPAVYSQMLIRFYSFLYKEYATSLALLQQVSGWMWDGGILLTALISLRLFVCFSLMHSVFLFVPHRYAFLGGLYWTWKADDNGTCQLFFSSNVFKPTLCPYWEGLHSCRESTFSYNGW